MLQENQSLNVEGEWQDQAKCMLAISSTAQIKSQLSQIIVNHNSFITYVYNSWMEAHTWDSTLMPTLMPQFYLLTRLINWKDQAQTILVNDQNQHIFFSNPGSELRKTIIIILAMPWKTDAIHIFNRVLKTADIAIPDWIRLLYLKQLLEMNDFYVRIPDQLQSRIWRWGYGWRDEMEGFGVVVLEGTRRQTASKSISFNRMKGCNSHRLRLNYANHEDLLI